MVSKGPTLLPQTSDKEQKIKSRKVQRRVFSSDAKFQIKNAFRVEIFLLKRTRHMAGGTLEQQVVLVSCL